MNPLTIATIAAGMLAGDLPVESSPKIFTLPYRARKGKNRRIKGKKDRSLTIRANRRKAKRRKR